MPETSKTGDVIHQTGKISGFVAVYSTSLIMSNTISLPIPSSVRILVAAGERISGKTVIARYSETHQTETIHLAKLLGVPNHKIPKYLKKKAGDYIAAGDTIAQKKGFFSLSSVRSPINGKLVEFDLSRGTVSLAKQTKSDKTDMVLPVSGKILSIGRSVIEIEIENPVFPAQKGEGKSATGVLRKLTAENVGILDFQDDLEDAVVLCHSVQEAALVKFSVLGVRGIILQKMRPDITMPWVQVEDDIYGKLARHAGQKIWLLPQNRQIVLLDA